MSKVQFQQGGVYVGALRSGRISVLDPRNTLRPYVGLLDTPTTLVDFDWNFGSSHILGGLGIDGSVKVWDLRLPPSPSLVQAFPSSLKQGLQNTHGAQGSHGYPSDAAAHILWCPQVASLLAAVHMDAVHVYDTRRVGGVAAFTAPLRVSDGMPTAATWTSPVGRYVWRCRAT